MIGTAEEFVRLLTSENRQEQLRAQNDEATAEIWFAVIDQHPELKKDVAHNKQVPLSVLEVLATDPVPDVRWKVASKRKIGEELLRKLSFDTDESVRSSVARHRRTAVDVLERLTWDEWSEVRENAAHNLAGRTAGEPI